MTRIRQVWPARMRGAWSGASPRRRRPRSRGSPRTPRRSGAPGDSAPSRAPSTGLAGGARTSRAGAADSRGPPASFVVRQSAAIRPPAARLQVPVGELLLVRGHQPFPLRIVLHQRAEVRELPDDGRMISR